MTIEEYKKNFIKPEEARNLWKILYNENQEKEVMKVLMLT